MTQATIVNEFEKASLEEVTKFLSDAATQVKGVFDAHRGDDGQVRYHEVSGEEATILKTANEKMAGARERFEQLQRLAGYDDVATKLSTYLNTPVNHLQAVPQVKTPDISLGGYVAKALKARPYRNEPWTTGVGDWTDSGRRTGTMHRKAAPGTTEVKAVLGTDSALVDVDTEYEPESVRVGVVVETLYQPHNIAPMIPQVPTTQNAIPYMVETVNSEAAAETAEGALSPEASIEFAETSDPVRKISVMMPVTEELLADESGIRAIVDQRLRQFMGNREDLQILRGNGTAPNLSGILDRAGLQNTNYSLTGATAVGLAEAALTASDQIRTVFQTPTGFVMRIGTWGYIRVAKSDDGQYLFAGPAEAATPRLWGLPVTTNENMDNYTSNTNVPILVGDWQGAATLFRRQGVQVQVSDSHDDRFARGILTVRLTERLALVVWRPAGFATVTRTA